MKKEVKYLSSSGKEFVLNRDWQLSIREFNPNSVNWSYDSVSQQYGVTVSRFTKEPIQLEIGMTFRGKYEPKGILLDEFTAECERDILTKSPGRLVIGDEYLEGYFIVRNTEYSPEYNAENMTATFFAPYPFWVSELTRSFEYGSSGGGAYLDYKKNYKYDYTGESSGNTRWIIDHYGASHFKMTIYGYADSPQININNYPYKVYQEIEVGDHVTIDSRQNTVVLTHSNGTTENIFNKRSKDVSIFEPIPGGSNQITWSGSFGFDITLYIERSEPKWKLS